MSNFINTRIIAFDNGGETLDRYTVVYIETLERGKYGARAMSDNPTHPHGFGMYMDVCAEWVDDNKDAPIAFDDLPDECKSIVMRDLDS